jgi:hypothetical protein
MDGAITMPAIRNNSTGYELRDKLKEVLADYGPDDQLEALIMAIIDMGVCGSGRAIDMLSDACKWQLRLEAALEDEAKRDRTK